MVLEEITAVVEIFIYSVPDRQEVVKSGYKHKPVQFPPRRVDS